MADNKSENVCTDSGIPSNEEIIEELTKDLDSVLVKSEGNKNNCESVAEDKKSDENCSSDLTDLNGEVDTDEGKEETTKEIDEDFVDEEVLKDLEVTYSEEDKEVTYTMFYRVYGDLQFCYRAYGNTSFKFH